MVEQGRFARVGGADDGDLDPVTQPLASVAVVEMGGDLADQRRNPGLHRPEGAAGAIFLGEIDLGLGMGLDPHQTGTPILVERAQPAFHLTQRLATLGFGLGVDQVGQALDLGQVEFAVIEGAAGEFAGLRRPQAVNCGERSGHRGDHRTSAVDVDFSHVLTAEAMRARHPQHQPVVDRGAVRGIGDRRPHRPPRQRRRTAGQCCQGRAGIGTGHAENGDSGPPGAAR